jgi:hypothetical protein
VGSASSVGPSALSLASVSILTAALPTAPRNLTLDSRSTTSLKFQWEAPLDDGGVELLGYKVYVAAGNAAYVQVATASSTTDPTITVHVHVQADLTAGETYKFRVSAYNVIGEGEHAQLRTQQDLEGDAVDYVLAADLPEAPLNPPTLVTVSETAVSLTLSGVSAPRNGGSAVTGYLVEIDDGLGGLNGTASASGYRRVHDAMTTSLIINNLIGGRTYSIRYAARNKVYDSGNMFGCDSLKWSNTLDVLTAVKPATPKNLRQGVATDGTGRLLRFRTKLIVQWDPLADAELGSSQLASYTLGILDATSGTETVVVTSPQAAEHVFDPLISGQSYTIRIKATNLVGTSDWSDYTPALQPGVEPTRPGLITFTAATRTTITFSFSALTGQDTGGSAANPIPTKYHVYISLKENSDYRLLVTTATATPQVA